MPSEFGKREIGKVTVVFGFTNDDCELATTPVNGMAGVIVIFSGKLSVFAAFSSSTFPGGNVAKCGCFPLSAFR